jgi:hypothetical protein
MDNKKLKQTFMVIAVLHTMEALLAKRMARKRGKSPAHSQSA